MSRSSKLSVSFLSLLALLLAAAPSTAWDRTGHLVVARIAWEEMSPTARSAAADLLAAAPEDADLRQLLPVDSRPLALRQAEHFQNAAYWPDIVRDLDFPERHQKYHHGDWHWINHFFESRGPERAPYERTDLEPAGRIIERLATLARRLGEPDRPAVERAVYLAWVLHLAGDIHQPLHATARVTETEPRGDRGGNLFELGRRSNLHAYWDGILRATNFRWIFQGDDSYVRRIAESIAREHPPTAFGERLAERDVASWARESFEIAMASVYAPELERYRKPPRDYERRATSVARERVALAGYRLAALLAEQLGSADSGGGR